MMDEDLKNGEILGMSDEDIMKMSEAPAPKAADAAPADAAATEKQAPNTEETPAADAAPAADKTNTDAESGEGSDADGDEANGDQPGDSAPEGGKTPDADAGKEEKPEAKQTPAEEKPDAAVDYKAEYERLLAPFKANGRDMSVASVDEALTLMKMGANYNKKMAALKPNLRLLKLLENQDLLSEEKISYLVDLHNKQPEAISKLVKESGLNPLDLDPEKAGDYKPSTHSVDDRELALDTVLDEIQDSPTYSKTLEVVTKVWDKESKQILANNPEILKVIDAHMSSGIYEIVKTEVERERVFGRLNGLSDIAAYRQVGDAINARGGFNHLTAPKSNQGNPNTAPVVVAPKPKKVEDDKLNEKRRAAGVSQPAAPAPKANQDFNPLAMSDEEFAKAAAKLR
jgi:hypothetical protein